MIELGKVQKLKLVRRSKNGAYLGGLDEGSLDEILLPTKYVPEEMKVGDEIEVFVYKDSEDRKIATTRIPRISIGELAKLRVADTSRIGAFLDWGLEKDLLLPFKEQTRSVVKNGVYLVGLYVDKSERLCATMDIYKLLNSTSPYKENEWVKGTIYNINPEIGAFVAVDDKYNGMIPWNELYGSYQSGDVIEARVKKVKTDGKLELSLRRQAHNEIEDDAKKIFDKLEVNGGKLALNDDSSPEEIKVQLNMSKNAFKRAVGKLYKERKIKITEKGIERV